MDNAAECPPVVGFDRDAVAVAALHNYRVLQKRAHRPRNNRAQTLGHAGLCGLLAAADPGEVG